MRFHYYPDTDMLYIELVADVNVESEEVAQNIVLDYSANNQVIGIEIEGASKLIDLSRPEISSLPIVSLVLNDSVPAGS